MLVHLVPALPPSINGIADYCYKLWQHWPMPQPQWHCLSPHVSLQNRAHWPEVEMTEFVPNEQGLLKKLNSLNWQYAAQNQEIQKCVVLHYVSFGYHPKGCPLWLPRALKTWKRQNAGRVVVMFHELYARGTPRQSAFYLSPLARGIMVDLIRLSDGWVTSCAAAEKILLREAHACANQGRVLPIGSAIEPASDVVFQSFRPLLQDTGLKIAVFGLPRTRLSALERHKRLLEALRASNNIESLHLIGKAPDAAIENATAKLLKSLALTHLVQSHYDLAPEKISAILQHQDLGLVVNTPDLLTKSSVYAALCAHELIVICAPDSSKDITSEGKYSLMVPYLENDDACPHLTLNALRDTARMDDLRNDTKRAASEILSWSSITRGWAEVIGDAI